MQEVYPRLCYITGKKAFHRRDVIRWEYMHQSQVGIQALCSQSFQNQDQDKAQVKKIKLMTFFETYYNYLTIDCWYLIKYVLQIRLFYERRGIFYSCDRYENLSPLNIRINFIIIKSPACTLILFIYHINGTKIKFS